MEQLVHKQLISKQNLTMVLLQFDLGLCIEHDKSLTASNL
jgi:hypothetical protein